jgi:branched-chain amino acid transport system ATP-binding protein
MAYHWQLGAAVGPELRHWGVTLNVQMPGHWWAAAAMGLGGGWLLWLLGRLWRAAKGMHVAEASTEQAAQGTEQAAIPAPIATLAPAAPENLAPLARGDTPTGCESGALGQAAGLGLELRGVYKRLGSTDIIRGLDLQVHAGERLALIGPNGAGKSTLFDLISGRFAPDQGSIWLQGQPIHGLQPQHIHRLGLSRSFQITRLFGQLSVRDNLRCAALRSLGHGPSVWHRLDGLAEVNARADAWMAMVELTHRSHTPARALSYAEQRALELGVTLVSNPAVVLLDEPTAGMGHSDTRRFTQMIRRATQGRTLLTVEHDMGVVFDLAERVAVLVAGQVLAVDTPERIRADARVQQAYLGHG